MKMEIHHTGCLVKSIDESLGFYRNIFGDNKISPKIFISAQEVNVCFIEIGERVYLELVESTNDSSVVNKNMLKKGINYYHIGYMVSDFESTVIELEELGCKHLETFISEAFDNKRCAFLFTDQGSLIEIIER